MLENFWVIFDTCQYPQYYQDVHNLLALPEGATLRYDYKRKYLSDAAIAIAQGSEQLSILFVYAQKATEYSRVGGNSKPAVDGPFETTYIATRLGRMLSVTKDAESYYFDFQVLAYPNQNAKALRDILADLESRDEVPWNKWVSVSTQMSNFKELGKGEEHGKWSTIVDLLSASPIQFAGDAFWRLKGPFQGSAETPNLPQVEYYTEAGRSRQGRSFYPVVENTSWRLELISETGRRVTQSAEGDQPTSLYQVEAKSSDDKILTMTGNPIYALRHYTGQMIEYRLQSCALFGQTAADLILKTLPQITEWPSGPNLTLKHRLRRNKIRMGLGVLLGIVGTCCFVFGESKALEHHPWIQVVLKVGGVLLIVLAGFVITGTIVFKS